MLLTAFVIVEIVIGLFMTPLVGFFLGVGAEVVLGPKLGVFLGVGGSVAWMVLHIWLLLKLLDGAFNRGFS